MMPRPGATSKPETADKAVANERRVFVLRQGQPEAVVVAVGFTDGSWTEIVGGDIGEGDPLVVGSVEGS
ncbi:hypothetical protein [Aurantimonas sp. VKM B-3413]|uniref:hypothetical protein n=1 Tax=Aurantimonas sp. VKM B-3413 TaxID=2779401 RepID=UPI001E4775E8|nr:hypothetical protein [Aurantimonas sp. VKM B-3413]MCB8840168.1 hypothetical protein [Aurantimonas sp. VKM B-3413]